MENYDTIPFKELSLEAEIPAPHGVGDPAHFKNPRKHYDKRSITELAESIRTHGLYAPLVVWRPEVDAKTKAPAIVLGGSRRYKAIAMLVKKRQANGLRDAVPCRLVAAETLAEAKVKALTDNLHRVDLTSFEQAETIAELTESGMSQKEIAKQLGKSATWVSRQLSRLKKSSEPVKKAWRDGKLPDDDVEHLSKLPEPEQDKRLARLLEHRQKAAAAASSGGKVRAERAKAREVAKNGAGAPRLVRPGADKLEALKAVCTAEGKKPRPEYVAGMHDALAFALGELGAGEFAKAFQTWAAAAAKDAE